MQESPQISRIRILSSELPYPCQSVAVFLLLGRDGEVYRNAGFSFDSLTRLQVGPEAPLLYCFAGRSGQNRGSTEHMKVLNISVATDQRFQHDRALHLHFLGQQGIVRLHRAGKKIGGAGRKMHSRGSIGDARGIGDADPDAAPEEGEEEPGEEDCGRSW